MATVVKELTRQIAELEYKLGEKNAALMEAQAALLDATAKVEEVTRDYQATIELAAIGIAHISPDAKLLFANKFLCEMLGYSEKELQSKTFYDLTYVNDLPRETQLLDEMLEGRVSSCAIENRYVKKSGDLVWGQLNVSLVLDVRGMPNYFIAIIHDIDARVRAQKIGEQSRNRLKAVLESLSEGVLVFSDEGNLLEANSAARKLFDYEPETAVRFDLAALGQTYDIRTLAGEQIPVDEWPVSKLLRGEAVTDVELIVHRWGTERYWMGSLSGKLVSIPPSSGTLAVFTVKDVTQRLLAETELRLSEQRLRLAFDQIPDMVVIYDPTKRIRYVNLAAVRNIGKTEDELIGQHAADAPANSILELFEPLLTGTLETAELQTMDFDFVSEANLCSIKVTCVPITDDGPTVREIMVLCHDYSERRQAEERIRQAALHDPLTGLANRSLLYEIARHTFAAADRNGKEVAVLFIDLDRFKPINEIHGHKIGDLVLHEVATRLKQNVRGEDMVFRLGGDEFLVLVPHHHGATAGEKAAQHVLNAISRPYHIGSVEATTSCSIGVSIYPRHGVDVDTLIGHADAAMYVAKQSGRKAIQLYTSSLAERIYMQSQIEDNLKTALKHDEFSLYYQPVVDMRTQLVVSVEALLRWPSNNIGPDRFIYVAEATGLIAPLGKWVFAQACAQHSKWIKEGLPAIPIAVNVSPIQFRKKDFAHELHNAIYSQSIGYHAVQIELTETAVMEDIDHAIIMLNELRRNGIKISLDDFGTGYSSLNYLSRLPLDKIKVDKSFVQRIQNDTASRAIIEAIIALGRTLSLEVVAEGIESDATLQYLRHHGCDQAQGYHVCKPIIGSEFATWYRQYNASLQ